MAKTEKKTVKSRKLKPEAQAAPSPTLSKLEQLEAEFERRELKSALGGGIKAIARQHAKGNLTAMERMGLFFDTGTFQRLYSLRGANNSGDGVVAGWGLVDGRKVYAYAWDFTNFAGTCSADNGRAIGEVIDSARREFCPIVGLNDSGGARVQDGVASLFGYGHIFNGHIDASGYVPQNLRHHRPLRRRRGLCPRPDRFRLHVEDGLHGGHRPRSHEIDDGQEPDHGGAGRLHRAQRKERARQPRRR
jgi:hypothetical protein